MSVRAIITASCYLHFKTSAPSFTNFLPITVGTRSCVPPMTRRRSPRLLALAGQKGGACGGVKSSSFATISSTTSNSTTKLRSLSFDDKDNYNNKDDDSDGDNVNDNDDLLKKTKGKRKEEDFTLKKKRKTRNTKTGSNRAKKKQASTATTSSGEYLPRSREEELKQDVKDLLVIGVDEAGRGPLAGPVVAAAAIVPTNIVGVTDSKKLTKEEDREILYEKITSSPDARWSVAVVDAKRIDEINILQATLTAMRMAASALISQEQFVSSGEKLVDGGASSKIEGSYVVCGSNDPDGRPSSNFDEDASKKGDLRRESYYALIDGNRVPKEFPCDCEAMVKGDSREYSIGAASILAKVTRDRIMREYDILYPEYELSRHKGKEGLS